MVCAVANCASDALFPDDTPTTAYRNHPIHDTSWWGRARHWLIHGRRGATK
jgi:hypothetical protein